MDEGTQALLFLLGAIIFFCVALFVYILPITIAQRRKHPQKNAIIILTIFGGWTAFLWVAALAWSVMAFEVKTEQQP